MSPIPTIKLCVFSDMVRKYIRKRIQAYNEESFKRALNAVNAGMLIRQAAWLNQISFKTLRGRLKLKHSGDTGRPTQLSLQVGVYI